MTKGYKIYKKCKKCHQKYGTDYKSDNGVCPKCSYLYKFERGRRKNNKYEK